MDAVASIFKKKGAHVVKDMDINNKPKVIFLYLTRDYGGSSDTFDELAPSVHLRPILGLQYLVGACRSIGVESIILDQRIMHFDELDVLDLIQKNDCMLLGFYTSFMMTDVNASFIKKLRRHSNIPVILGGPGYLEYEELFEAGADIVARGEGEETLKEVVRKVQKNDHDWSSVEGIYYKEEDRIAATKERTPIQNLDENAWPVRDNLLPIDIYKDYYLMGMRMPYMTMISARGCPHKCTYCDSPIVWQNVVRMRSPDSTIAEIDYAVERWGVRYIDMLDDVFGMNIKRVEEFSTKLIERKYDLHYKMLVNPSTFGKHREKAFKLLSASGASIVGIGMQSADKNTLDELKRKKDTRENLISQIAAARTNGMLTFVSFIAGFPDEPEDAPKKIMDLVDEARPTIIDCYPLVYLKGTPLDIAVNVQKTKEDTYTYDEKVEKALAVKKHFNSQPRNLFNIVKWIALNNPSWFLFFLRNFVHIFKLGGFGETRIGQSSAMRRLKAKLRNSGLSWDNPEEKREEYTYS